MKKVLGTRLLLVAAAVAIVALPALADVTDINSVKIQERYFNDYPGSTLVTTNTYPTLVSFVESNYGAGGWANRHLAMLSADSGATNRAFQNSEAFHFSFDVMLDAGSLSPRKEAGMYMETFIGGSGQFMVASDGEVAAFGSFFPFYSFGGSAYTAGTTATMEMIYKPGAVSTLEYVFNGVSSGPLACGNLENGVIDGSILGGYGNFQPNDSNPSDFTQLEYTNWSIVVPEPGTALLVLIGLAWLRRR